MYAYESNQSPNPTNDGSVERIFTTLGTSDWYQAAAAALAASGATYQGRTLTGEPDIRPLGYDAFEVRLKYDPPEKTQKDKDPEGETPTDAVIEFDTGGATQHITTAISGRHYPSSAADMQRSIGVSRDSIEGVDIVVPDFKFSISHKWTAAGVQAFGGGAYIFSLYRLTGKTNQSPYTARGTFQGVAISLDFEAGELLFLGASGGGDGSFFPIKYSFAASQNRTDLSISSSVTNIDKKGHEYLWVAFEGSENQNKLVQTPIAAYVDKVYEEADFASVLKF